MKLAPSMLVSVSPVSNRRNLVDATSATVMRSQKNAYYCAQHVSYAPVCSVSNGTLTPCMASAARGKPWRTQARGRDLAPSVYSPRSAGRCGTVTVLKVFLFHLLNTQLQLRLFKPAAATR